MRVRGRFAGTCAVAGPILFTVAWLVAWPVQDEYSPRREDISALAALDAQHAWIMILGFLAFGLGAAALGVGLLWALAGGTAARVGAVLALVAGIGIIVAGLARNDCSSELASCAALVDAGDVSWHHQVHDLVSALVFLCLFAAQVLLARAFRIDPRWSDLWVYSLASGLATLVLLVVYGTSAFSGWDGLVQRVFIAVPQVWMVVLGLRLRRLGAAEGMPAPT
jgi:hypothetical membrane protein